MTYTAPTYGANAVPAHLLTEQQLRQRKLCPSDPATPAGYMLVALYDQATAQPCTDGPPDTAHVLAVAAMGWAQEVLADPDAIVLDTECTDFNGRVIEIATVAVATGEVLTATLLNPGSTPIHPDAQAKHGLSAAMVTAPGVPSFSDICDQLGSQLAGKRIVGWKSGFDRERLAAEALRAGASGEWAPGAVWEDAMERHAQWRGELTARGTFKWHPLDGGHRALTDCYEVIARLKEMADPANLPAPKPKRGPEEWTPEQDAELTHLHATGQDPDVIARQLGHTTNSVRWRLSKLGLASPRLSRRNRFIPMPANAGSLRKTPGSPGGQQRGLHSLSSLPSSAAMRVLSPPGWNATARTPPSMG